MKEIIEILGEIGSLLTGAASARERYERSRRERARETTTVRPEQTRHVQGWTRYAQSRGLESDAAALRLEGAEDNVRLTIELSSPDHAYSTVSVTGSVRAGAPRALRLVRRGVMERLFGSGEGGDSPPRKEGEERAEEVGELLSVWRVEGDEPGTGLGVLVEALGKELPPSRLVAFACDSERVVLTYEGIALDFDAADAAIRAVVAMSHWASGATVYR